MKDLRAYGACTLDEDGCISCGDVGIPVRIVHLLEGHSALCEDRRGQRAEIDCSFAPEAAAGDVLLVHAGVAIAHLNAQGAAL